MAETGYSVVNWQPNDLVTDEKLQQESTNIDYLRDNTPRVEYQAFGVRQPRGIKIACGVAVVPKDTKSARGNAAVHFGEFFSSGCRPIVTTGIVGSQNRIHVILSGLNEFFPEDTGFRVHLTMDNPDPKKNKIDKRVLVTWIAMGY